MSQPKARKEARRAYNEVRRAVQRGDLPRLNRYQVGIRCVDCGAPATQWDHRSYSRPLDVDPVCSSCNIRRGPATHSESNVNAPTCVDISSLPDAEYDYTCGMDLLSWLDLRADDAAVSKSLGVTRHRVTAWRLGKAFPRPPQLVALKELSGGIIDFDASIERAARERAA